MPDFLDDLPDLAELTHRIDAVCARATMEGKDASLLAEIEDLLAEGYICALHGDGRSRRLQQRFDALVMAVDPPASAAQFQSIAREQRLVSEATRELRAKLAVMRRHGASLGSDRVGLA